MGRLDKLKRQAVNEANKRVLGEKDREKDWREDSSWEDDDGIITLGDVVDYLGDNVRNISVSDLQNKLKLPLANVTKELDRLKIADLQYPIILVQEDGEFSYVLDGNHRVEIAINLNKEYIKAKVLYLDDENTPPEFKRLLGTNN
jgi:hypothetical protein